MMQLSTAASRSVALRRRPHTGRDPGFALVIVLWVLAGLTVVAVAVASSARVSNQSIRTLRDRVQAEAAFVSTAARVKVIASTGVAERLSISGPLGRLLTDGRYSRAGPGESVALQDVRGLLDLNRNQPKRLEALLRLCGATEEQIEPLVDSLADYVDADGEKRLNGAEAFQYRESSQVEPRNARLLTREELWRIKGWPELRPAWQKAGCDRYVTTHGDGRFNANTAPLPLLLASGMTPDAAAAQLEARKEGFDLLATQVAAGIPGDAFGGGGGYVGSVLRVTHRLEASDTMMVYDLELTSTRAAGPWRVHEIRYRPRPSSPVEALAELPLPGAEPHRSEPALPNALFRPSSAN